MAYRLLREFSQAFTRLDTPPFSIRHHPGSVTAPKLKVSAAKEHVAALTQIPNGQGPSPFGRSLPDARARAHFCRRLNVGGYRPLLVGVSEIGPIGRYRTLP